MILSKDSERLLDKWVNTGTWYTDHFSDLELWYDFINQYYKDHGPSINEDDLFYCIASETKANIKSKDLLNILRERIRLAENILHFLRHINN